MYIIWPTKTVFLSIKQSCISTSSCVSTGGPHGKAGHVIAITPPDEKETFSTGDGWRRRREGVPYVVEYLHSGRIQQGNHTPPLRLSLSKH